MGASATLCKCLSAQYILWSGGHVTFCYNFNSEQNWDVLPPLLFQGTKTCDPMVFNHPSIKRFLESPSRSSSPANQGSETLSVNHSESESSQHMEYLMGKDNGSLDVEERLSNKLDQRLSKNSGQVKWTRGVKTRQEEGEEIVFFCIQRQTWQIYSWLLLCLLKPTEMFSSSTPLISTVVERGQLQVSLYCFLLPVFCWCSTMCSDNFLTLFFSF